MACRNVNITYEVGGKAILTRCLNRYGLLSKLVLRALEGLPGVSDCQAYRYVAEDNLWRNHIAKIRHSCKQIVVSSWPSYTCLASDIFGLAQNSIHRWQCTARQ